MPLGGRLGVESDGDVRRQLILQDVEQRIGEHKQR